MEVEEEEEEEESAELLLGSNPVLPSSARPRARIGEREELRGSQLLLEEREGWL